MAPIHDSDIAEERWSKAEWESYELWEQVELREKRKRRIWIFSTLVLFLILSAVPIVMERWPRWTTRSLARQLAQQITQLKRLSGIARTPYRLRLIEGSQLQFRVERVTDCSAIQGELLETGQLGSDRLKGEYTWVSESQGAQVGVPGLVNQFCYDPFMGSDALQKGQAVVGFGLIPVKDLAERRLDRMAVMLLSGPSGEISFE